MSLGGVDGSQYAYVDISYASGQPMEQMLSFSKTPTAAGEWSISFSGINIQENALTAGTEPMVSRRIQITQSNLDSSGSVTFYVALMMTSQPIPITVTWKPLPYFGVQKTSYTRTDTGDAIVHTFGLRIQPNQSFGTPRLELNSYGSAVNRCKADSVMSMQTIYNGTRDFTLRCVVPKVACDKQPCPLISDTTIKLGVSAQSPSGKYITSFGGENLNYEIPKIFEYL